MIKGIKKLFKQYFICKHENEIVLRKIGCPSESVKMKWMERLECTECKKQRYSDYFFEYGTERHYVKH